MRRMEAEPVVKSLVGLAAFLRGEATVPADLVRRAGLQAEQGEQHASWSPSP